MFKTLTKYKKTVLLGYVTALLAAFIWGMIHGVSVLVAYYQNGHYNIQTLDYGLVVFALTIIGFDLLILIVGRFMFPYKLNLKRLFFIVGLILISPIMDFSFIAFGDFASENGSILLFAMTILFLILYFKREIEKAWSKRNELKKEIILFLKTRESGNLIHKDKQ